MLTRATSALRLTALLLTAMLSTSGGTATLLAQSSHGGPHGTPIKGGTGISKMTPHGPAIPIGNFGGGGNKGGNGGSTGSPPSAGPPMPSPGECPGAPPAKASTRSGASNSGATSGAAPGAGASRGGATRGSTSESECGALYANVELWWRWWELNRLQLLLADPGDAPQRALSPSTRYAHEASLLTPQEATDASLRLLPLLFAACTDDDPQVRAAAATVAGRIGGEAAVPQLRKLLGDRVQRVRESALLALGATGSSQAAPFLLDLASNASRARKSRQQELSPDAPSLAWVALGLGRERGFSDGVGDLMVDLVDDQHADRLFDLTAATLLYQRLSPGDDLDRIGQDRLGDVDVPLEVRARAAESLGTLADPTMIPLLHQALHADDLPLRRSAALALASFQSTPLLADLARHLDTEQDELLRGYLLLAIAQHDSGDAVEILTATLHAGDALLRPWSALALGLVARRDADRRPAITATLRKEAESSGSVSDRLALMLASGLARDDGRAEEFLELLAGSGDGRTRLVAAQSLNLLGVPDDEDSELAGHVRLALGSQLRKEGSPEVRGALAEALGVHHDVGDVPALLAAVARLHAGEPAADLAHGCGAHRTRAMLTGLSELVADPSLKAPARAAAWESLGLLLDQQGRARLPQAMAGAELDALPDWCDRLLAESTL